MRWQSVVDQCVDRVCVRGGAVPGVGMGVVVHHMMRELPVAKVAKMGLLFATLVGKTDDASLPQVGPTEG